ncbi:hypothetical protein FRB99_003653 [Tulasnella sp. 403]|nr:hypothetical protein FRB99_003653 [Tulasnella sp. 403]
MQISLSPDLPAEEGMIPAPKIMDLPNELLSVIFAMHSVCPRDCHCNVSDMVKEFNTSATLLQVCRHWYCVAIAIPNLWTTFILTPDWQIPMTMVEERLRRAKMAPLSLFAGNNVGVVVEALQRFYEMQVADSGDLRRRIQSLSLYLNLGVSLPNIQPVADLVAKFPLLEHLNVTNTGLQPARSLPSFHVPQWYQLANLVAVHIA